jgi:hypothetical protein
MLVEVQVRAQFRARIPCQTNSTRTFMGVPTVFGKVANEGHYTADIRYQNNWYK